MNKQELCSQFMDEIQEKFGEGPEVSWNDCGEEVEIILETESLNYAFLIRPEKEDFPEEEHDLAKAHRAISDAIKEVINQ